MRLLPLLLALALTLSADAATVMRVTSRHSETPQRVRTMTVTRSVADLRVDIPQDGDGPIVYDALISRDGGATFIALNSGLRTWYTLKRPPLTLSSRFLMPNEGDRISKVKWAMTTKGETQIGRLTFTRTIVRGYRANVDHTAVIEIEIDPATPRTLWPASVPLITDIPEIDSAIASTPLAGFPKRITATVTRQYQGGAPDTQTMSLEVEEIREVAKIDPRMFERPRDYREQEPVIGFPGRS